MLETFGYMPQHVVTCGAHTLWWNNFSKILPTSCVILSLVVDTLRWPLIFEYSNFQHYHCGAVALAINLVLWLGTKLYKRHQLLFALTRDLKYFDDVELVFPRDKFQVNSIFNMFLVISVLVDICMPR